MDVHFLRRLTYVDERKKSRTVNEGEPALQPVPLIILGDLGMGKTQLLQQWGQSDGYRYFTANRFYRTPLTQIRAGVLLLDALDEISAGIFTLYDRRSSSVWQPTRSTQSRHMTIGGLPVTGVTVVTALPMVNAQCRPYITAQTMRSWWAMRCPELFMVAIRWSIHTFVSGVGTMFVTFDGTVPRLADIDNFRALKVVVVGGEQPPLDGVGRVDGDHVWLDRGWLETNGRPADPDWAKAFAGMIGYAEKSGWVDDSGAVRAHIETTQV